MNDLEIDINKYKYQILQLKKYTKNMSILMAEDYVILHNSLKKILNSLFEIVDTAFDGKEALLLYEKRAQQNKFYDIVLSDIVMPNMDGIELSKAIRDINSTQTIVILSAHKELDYLLEFINIGVRRFIPKPITLELFLDELFLICSDIYKQNELSNIVNISNTIFFNKEEKVLYMDGKSVVLSNYEQLVIEKLLSKLNQSVSNDELVNYLYLNCVDVSLENIRKLMYKLRQKLPKEFIQNVHGIGYRITQVIDDK